MSAQAFSWWTNWFNPHPIPEVKLTGCQDCLQWRLHCWLVPTCFKMLASHVDPTDDRAAWRYNAAASVRPHLLLLTSAWHFCRLFWCVRPRRRGVPSLQRHALHALHCTVCLALQDPQQPTLLPWPSSTSSMTPSQVGHLSKPDACPAMLNRTEQNRTEQNRTEQNRTEQTRPDHEGNKQEYVQHLQGGEGVPRGGGGLCNITTSVVLIF